MPDIQMLKQLSVEDLLKELRAREAKAGEAALAAPLEPSEDLREFDDVSIATVLKENQKGSPGTAVMSYRYKGVREHPGKMIAAQVPDGSDDGQHHSGSVGCA